MRAYAIERKDGGQSLMMILPQVLARASDGYAFAIQAFEKQDDKMKLWLQDVSVPLGEGPPYQAMIDYDSFINGLRSNEFSFGYPSIESEINKWHPDDRANVVGWRQVKAN